jgi:hypothetical protein
LIDPVPNAEKRRAGLLLEYHRPSVIAKGAARMDTILLIMFGALMSMTTALTFMEVRRIRKKLEETNAGVPKASAAQV